MLGLDFGFWKHHAQIGFKRARVKCRTVHLLSDIPVYIHLSTNNITSYIRDLKKDFTYFHSIHV